MHIVCALATIAPSPTTNLGPNMTAHKRSLVATICLSLATFAAGLGALSLAAVSGPARAGDVIITTVQPMSPQPRVTFETQPPFTESTCRDEIHSLCPGIRPGEGRIKACVNANLDRFSEACKAEIKTKREEHKGFRPTMRGVEVPGESASGPSGRSPISVSDPFPKRPVAK